jgi:hypothetical protein
MHLCIQILEMTIDPLLFFPNQLPTTNLQKSKFWFCLSFISSLAHNICYLINFIIFSYNDIIPSLYIIFLKLAPFILVSHKKKAKLLVPLISLFCKIKFLEATHREKMVFKYKCVSTRRQGWYYTVTNGLNVTFV